MQGPSANARKVMNSQRGIGRSTVDCQSCQKRDDSSQTMRTELMSGGLYAHYGSRVKEVRGGWEVAQPPSKVS
jgi:hypothetical protein